MGLAKFLRFCWTQAQWVWRLAHCVVSPLCMVPSAAYLLCMTSLPMPGLSYMSCSICCFSSMSGSFCIYHKLVLAKFISPHLRRPHLSGSFCSSTLFLASSYSPPPCIPADVSFAMFPSDSLIFNMSHWWSCMCNNFTICESGQCRAS